MTAGALQRRTRRINWHGGFNNSPRSIEYGQELQVAKLPAACCTLRQSPQWLPQQSHTNHSYDYCRD